MSKDASAAAYIDYTPVEKMAIKAVSDNPAGSKFVPQTNTIIWP